MAAQKTFVLFSSRSVKALALLLTVWTIAFSLFPDIDISPGFPGGRTDMLRPIPDGRKDRARHHDTLISFVYSESHFGKENLQYFVDMGLHQAADFVFIFNGKTDAISLLPKLDNIKVVERNNTCYDMGAIGEVMRTENLWKNYKKFISINSSLRGPFVPYWADVCWSDVFLNKITDSVKLVGMTANCFQRGHVQSMMFATDDVGMSILLDPDHSKAGVVDKFGGANDTVGLSGCYNTHDQAVHSEIGLTTLIQNAGYDVDVMMAAFHTESSIATYCNTTNMGDVLFDKGYYGFNVHPYETIFFKANRNIDPIAISKLTEWHLKRNVTSLSLCKPVLY